MIRILTQAKLARLTNVSTMAVSLLVNRGKLSKSKYIVNGKSKGVNVDHVLVVEWLATHNIFHVDDKYCKIVLTKKEARAARNDKTKPKRRLHISDDVTDVPRQEVDADTQSQIGGYSVDDLQSFTVREIIDRFSSVDGFKRFVESKRIILDNELKETKLLKARGELIDIGLVSQAIIDVIDIAFNRLVSDVPKRIAQQVVAVVEVGGPDVTVDIERIYRESTSAILQDVKSAIEKTKLLKLPKGLNS